MRIVNRLNAGALVVGLVLSVLLPIFIWTVSEFSASKTDDLIAGEILESISRSEELRNQYFLYREDRIRQDWERAYERQFNLLAQAAGNFKSEQGIKSVQDMQRSTEERKAIFRRLVTNSEDMRLSQDEGQQVRLELDKRLFSQLVLKAVEFRNLATGLQELCSTRVEAAYQKLIVSFVLACCLLAFAVLIGLHIARLLREGLVPLRLGMEKVAGGDLEFRVQAEGADEFVELSRSFNSMTDQLKQASSNLREAIDRLEKINSRVPGIVIIQFRKHADGKFSIPYASQALADIFHVSLEEVREDASAFLSAVHPDDLPQLLATLEQSAIALTPWVHEYRLQVAAGEPEVWLTTNAIPQPEKEGSVLWCGFITDNSEHKRLIKDLSSSESRFRRFFEKNSSVMLLIDPQTNCFIDANEAAVSFYGYPRERLTGMLVNQINTLSGPEIAAEIEQVMKLSARRFHFRHRLASGEIRDVEVYASSIDTGGRPLLLAIIHDETERKLAEEKLQLAANVFLNAREAIMIINEDGTILEVNESFSYITGFKHDEAMGSPLSLLAAEATEEQVYNKMWAELKAKGHWYGEVRMRRKNGEVITTLQTISAVRNSQAGQYVVLFSDITLIKAHASQLEHLAHYDPLTNLPNRVLLTDRLSQAMASERRRELMLALAYLDLDGFKAVNDLHGHEIGDKLLVALAENMQHTLREGDTLARIGGDEFVALMLDLTDASATSELLPRLLAAAAKPVQIGELTLQVSASLGVTFFPQVEAVDSDQLLRQADQAMYTAKLSGRNRFHVFDADLDRSVRGHHESVDRIRLALLQGEFTLFYQPKVNMRSGALLGAEALIRWQHPERGLLSPALFLPEIEGHRLAVSIGEWVIGEALSQVELWRASGLDIPVSVNVSARQLQQFDFADRLRSMLAAHPLVQPTSLELEILETSALRDIAQIARLIETCAAFGVTFSLDDFGTGYSSLTYLKRLKVTTLKIDQSFVRGMLDDPEDLVILEGIVSLAEAFDRKVIAEGVETVAHGKALLGIGCTMGQGYGIARPMPAAELPQWVASWRPDPSWQGTAEPSTPAH
jgi:diguanylate cyclase (GGDEF)-like protein/PAS domain S-box-containing protein